MLELDEKLLKKAIKNVEHRVDNSAKNYKVLDHCIGCVAHQYFFLLSDSDKDEAWVAQEKLGTEYACCAIWKLIDLKYKRHFYSMDKFERCDEEPLEDGHNCKYPNYKTVASLLRAAKI
jgi:hypothetical protein